MYDIIELSRKLLPDLKEIAKELDIKKVESFKKQDLIYKILDTQAILASEKKTEDKKFKSPRDLTTKREENSVFKLFSRKKEEKPAEVAEEKPTESKEQEKPETQSNTDQPKQEGKRELQIKKRPRTEHVKAGSSNPNTNQNIGQRPAQNQNQNQRPAFRQEKDVEQKQIEQPKQNQAPKVRQEILLPEDIAENETLFEPIESVEEQVTSQPKSEVQTDQPVEELKTEEVVEKRNENLHKKKNFDNNPKWENRDNKQQKQPQQAQEKPYEFEETDGNPIAGHISEEAVFDQNGVRLNTKLGNIDGQFALIKIDMSQTKTHLDNLDAEVNSYRQAVVTMGIDSNHNLVVSQPDTLTDVYAIDTDGNLTITY